MSSQYDLFRQYQGELVPRTFNAAFVVLSYIISLTGAASTLELINRRTSRNGFSNHILLFIAAITMGGIAIWSMHFIGNRAIVLANDEAGLQIVYSSGFTALSFFIPIIVLLAAFVAIGAKNTVSWWRIGVGGSLAGAAICGMHYLGNASIDNYSCEYNPINVVGSVVIAFFASIVALSLFFAFRASWTNTWWKRVLCSFVLAGAVSGMHWCASTGTDYRLVRLSDNNQPSRNTTVIIVIFLSVAAALIMTGVAISTTLVRRRYASKAKQVVLAAALFDKDGRILVNPDGLLPSEKITDTYVEKTPSDTFSVAHPLFHWMFQASRNWNAVSPMISGMANHLAHVPKSDREKRLRLINDNGQLTENYDIIFRELFCLAAANLADKTKEQLGNVGILWDEILPTGGSQIDRQRHGDDVGLSEKARIDLMCEEGQSRRLKPENYGRGSLMFLVRRLENYQDVEKLEAAGYRFADVQQVCSIISTSMQIKTSSLSSKLMNMATYAEESTMMQPGVHLGFFGVRARVGTPGFDVLVNKGARNLLPTMQMALERIEPWQTEMIRQLDKKSVRELLRRPESFEKLPRREMLFVSQVTNTLELLHTSIGEPIFDEAILTSKLVQVPWRARAGYDSPSDCTLIAFHLMIPIHTSISNEKLEFVPLNFFKVHQMVYRDSPQHAAFSRYVHRELSPFLTADGLSKPGSTHCKARRSMRNEGRFSSMRKPFSRNGRLVSGNFAVDAEGKPIPTDLGKGMRLSSKSSSHSASPFKFWRRSDSDAKASRDDGLNTRTDNTQVSGLGGIMVSQEIKVDVSQAEDMPEDPSDGRLRSECQGPLPATSSKAKDEMDFEMSCLGGGGKGAHAGIIIGSTKVESEKADAAMTFVDDLFAVCVDAR